MHSRAIFILILILFLGFILRFSHFQNTLGLEADQAAAFLLADRILHHGHILLVGPITSATPANILPPTYYYIITFLYAIVGSETAVTYIFAFAGVLTLMVAFLLSKELFNTKTALITAFLMSISDQMVRMSRNIWEPNLIPFFILLSLYFQFIAVRKKNTPLYYISLPVFSLSLMYVSGHLFLPGFAILSFINYKKMKHPERTISYLKPFFILSLFIILQYLPLFLYEYQNKFPTITFFSHGQISYLHLNLASFFLGFSQHLDLFLRYFISSNYSYSIFFLIPILVVAIPSFARFFLQNRNFLLIFGVTVISFLFTSLYHGKPEPHRLVSIYPFFFILFAYLLYIVTTYKKRMNIMFVFILYYFIVFIQGNLYNSIFYFLYQQQIENTRSLSEITTYMLSSAKGKSLSIFTITTTDKFGYYSLPFYYMLEKTTHREYVPLTREGNWIDTRVNKNVYRIFLVCKWFDRSESEQSSCVQPFQRKEKLESYIHIKRFKTATVYEYKGDLDQEKN